MECPPCLGALDGRHITKQNPKKPGSEYYNYKGFFSHVLLTLVNAEYRFVWLDVKSSGSSLDAQIFNCRMLRKKIKDGTLGLLAPEPLGEGEPNFIISCGGNDTFALIPSEQIQRKTTHKGRENSKL